LSEEEPFELHVTREGERHPQREEEEALLPSGYEVDLLL
jgi:hypothetical protein